MENDDWIAPKVFSNYFNHKFYKENWYMLHISVLIAKRTLRYQHKGQFDMSRMVL